MIIEGGWWLTRVDDGMADLDGMVKAGRSWWLRGHRSWGKTRAPRTHGNCLYHPWSQLSCWLIGVDTRGERPVGQSSILSYHHAMFAMLTMYIPIIGWFPALKILAKQYQLSCITISMNQQIWRSASHNQWRFCVSVGQLGWLGPSGTVFSSHLSHLSHVDTDPWSSTMATDGYGWLASKNWWSHWNMPLCWVLVCSPAEVSITQ